MPWCRNICIHILGWAFQCSDWCSGKLGTCCWFSLLVLSSWNHYLEFRYPVPVPSLSVYMCDRVSDPLDLGVPGGCELHGVGAGNQTLLRFSGLCLWGTGLLLWFSWVSVLQLFLFGCCGWADGTKAHSSSSVNTGLGIPHWVTWP